MCENKACRHDIMGKVLSNGYRCDIQVAVESSDAWHPELQPDVSYDPVTGVQSSREALSLMPF